jgi:hypothetical protein
LKFLLSFIFRKVKLYFNMKSLRTERKPSTLPLFTLARVLKKVDITNLCEAVEGKGLLLKRLGHVNVCTVREVRPFHKREGGLLRETAYRIEPTSLYFRPSVPKPSTYLYYQYPSFSTSPLYVP